MPRPNVVCIMSDEHDPGVTGCYGDPLVGTPNLDRLAAEGVLCEAAYCNSPLCVPSRLSFTAGKYVHRIGAWNNTCWIEDAAAPTLPTVLAAAGYRSYLCGKQHYDRSRRYGFVDIMPDDRHNGFCKTGRLQRRGADESAEEGGLSWSSRSADFRVAEDSGNLAFDRDVTDRACRFLADGEPGDEPFLLFVGHIAPHFPLIVPERYAARYRGRVPMPELPEGLVEGLPFNYRQLRRGFGVEAPDPAVVGRGRELYWALVDWYDGQIGRLLDGLAGSRYAENTVVIYTSDHGENKGDHGLWWKNNCYEHAARVPLIWRWPGGLPAGERRAGACSLVDAVQGICELAGAEAPADWDGDSLLGYLRDGEAPWKDRAICQYYGHNVASGMSMLREGRFKYIHHARADAEHGPVRELFDLETDPGEFHDLAGDPAQAERLDAMHDALVFELGEEPDETELRLRRERVAPYERD